jgi:hypothetical protein
VSMQIPIMTFVLSVILLLSVLHLVTWSKKRRLTPPIIVCLMLLVFSMSGSFLQLEYYHLFNYNDIGRICLYLLFLSVFVSRTDQGIIKEINIVSEWSLYFIFTLVILERQYITLFTTYYSQMRSSYVLYNYNPGAFYFDPNMLSLAVSVALAIQLLRMEKSNTFKVIMFIVSFYVIVSTDSRMGLLMAVVLTIMLLSITLRNSLKNGIIITISVAIFVGSIFVLKTIVTEEGSLVAQFRDTPNQLEYIDDASDSERLQSLQDGLYYFVSNAGIPVGSIAFRASWSQNGEVFYHLPHSGIVYLLAEYGVIGLIIIIYILYVMIRATDYRNSFVKSAWYVSIVMFIGFVLLPNVIYYFTLYIALQYVYSWKKI